MLKLELVQTDKHSIKILLRRKNLRFLRRTNNIQTRWQTFERNQLNRITFKNYKQKIYDMKKILIFIITIVTLSSCSNDDSINDKIVGEWKLIGVSTMSFNPNSTIDYSNENITYNFQSNGILLVTGGQNVGYTNGEYEYFFGEDYLSGAPSPGESKTLLVKINSTKWTYDLTNGVMTLSTSYVDGPILRFERK